MGLVFDFALTKEYEPKQQRDQREREEYRPAMAVNGRINHVRTDANTKLRDGKNTKAIA